MKRIYPRVIIIFLIIISIINSKEVALNNGRDIVKYMNSVITSWDLEDLVKIINDNGLLINPVYCEKNNNFISYVYSKKRIKRIVLMSEKSKKERYGLNDLDYYFIATLEENRPWYIKNIKKGFVYINEKSNHEILLSYGNGPDDYKFLFKRKNVSCVYELISYQR